MQTSVLTLVRGRETALRHLMSSLSRQSEPPGELVIAWMQDEVHDDLPDPGCPVRHVFQPGDRLPLAAARNRAAAAATGELLIFLDVDCIASPGLVGAYQGAAEKQAGLFLGEVYYLPEGQLAEPLDYAALDDIGIVHPAKPSVPDVGIRLEPDPGELWGLSFALPASAYRGVGGMDEDFVGYGGEETDFARRLHDGGLPFFWVAGARAYHQHHPVRTPPLHQFDDILANASRFYAKHGRWCMDYWLGQFAASGLIDWERDGSTLSLRRRPEPAEIDRALQPGSVRFS